MWNMRSNERYGIASKLRRVDRRRLLNVRESSDEEHQHQYLEYLGQKQNRSRAFDTGDALSRFAMRLLLFL